MRMVLMICPTCQLCDEVGLARREPVVDLDDIIVPFKNKTGEGKLHILLIVTSDCPHTVEVVGICLWELGGGEGVVIAEMSVSSTGALEGGRGRGNIIEQ